MNTILDYLKQLSEHNNRAWFNEHKAEYLECKLRFDKFVEDVVSAIRSFDSSIGELSASDCTWRIYRDTRFSADKRPYKTHFGGYVAPTGKKGPYSGYYFQIGVAPENSFLAVGNYYTEPQVLKILREDIDMDQAQTLEAALNQARGFSLDTEQCLKRVPRGFDADRPYSEYFKFKNFCLIKPVDEAYIASSDFKEKMVNDFMTTKPFIDFINRAIAYSLDEDLRQR